MPKLTINHKPIEVPAGITVLQACELAGVEIPRFCYHDRLKIAGNCRMCLVEVKGGPPKPAASCAFPVAEGMVVLTDSPMVKKAREGVMEFLLINHPLDCPICDQGGECDLQDQAMTYGRGGNRFHENKRAVQDKPMGPLIKTHMTRCIHCTRCIRFTEEIAGMPELGVIGRGEHMEVTAYLDHAVTSELSGNVIDLCPVGALTSKPYAFKARSWELEKTETIDVLDAVGSNIRVDSRGREVMRVLPRLNEEINEEWISDKTRFAYDGLKAQRLDRPYVKINGKLQPATWEQAYSAIAKRLTGVKGEQIAAIAGDMADIESMLVLKELMRNLGSNNVDCRQDGAKLEAEGRASYLFNTTIAGIEHADACLIIGANPRFEAPLVNARLRKRWLKGGFPVAAIGMENDLTYKVNNIGHSPVMIDVITQGKHEFGKALKTAQRPMVILGYSALTRSDGAAILHRVRELCDRLGVVKEGWNGFNVLHKAASRVGGMDIGFLPGEKGISGADIEVAYLLGADELDMKAFKNTFVIYQGHHGDRGAHVADVILPGAAYTEKDGTYVNLEGRAQRAYRAVFPPGEAKEDWKIITELSNALGHALPYVSLPDVRKRMEKVAPHLARVDEIVPAAWSEFGHKGRIADEPFHDTIANFYMTDPISRASGTMARCAEELLKKREKRAVA